MTSVTQAVLNDIFYMCKEGDQEEYDDVWSITEDLRNLLGRTNLFVL